MSDTLAFGQYLTLRTPAQEGGYLFQNYWVNEDAPFANVDTGQISLFGYIWLRSSAGISARGWCG